MKEWFTGRPKKEETEPEFWWDEQNKVLRRVYDSAEDMPDVSTTGAFDVVETTKYGPVLRRRSEEVEETVTLPDYSELRPLEHPKSELREPRPSAPVSYRSERMAPIVEDEYEEDDEDNEEEEFEEDEQPDPSRRGFLTGLGALGGVAALGAVAAVSAKESPDRPRTKEQSAPSVEAQEAFPGSIQFATEVEGYEKFTELKYTEVLFVDDLNRPIGGPIELHDFDIMRETESGERTPYKVSPGPMDELGILTGGGIAGEWLAEMRIKLKEKYPNIEVDLKKGKPRVLSINTKFYSVVYDGDDAELIGAIANGHVKSYIDIVNHYALRKTPETGGLSIREYIENNIQFRAFDPVSGEGVPPLVAAELRRIIPGLCAQESNFNNESVSKSGARGIFQFMPATWGDYDPNEEGIVEGVKSLEKQVRNAGEFFSDLYIQVQHHAGKETIEKLKTLYGDEVLERDILVPLMINAYNAGGALMGEALRLYVERTDVANRIPPGKDLFIEIANFAHESDEGKYLDRYGDEARQYVTRIYANSNVLHA